MKVNNIFLVEDDEFFALGFIKKLQKVGDFNIHHYISSERALGQLHQIKPEIIFLDHDLGGVNGVDAIPLFKEFSPDSDIVIVSGQRDPQVLVQALETGAEAYFTKDVLLMSKTIDFVENAAAQKSIFSTFWTDFLNLYKNIPTKL